MAGPTASMCPAAALAAVMTAALTVVSTDIEYPVSLRAMAWDLWLTPDIGTTKGTTAPPYPRTVW